MNSRNTEIDWNNSALSYAEYSSESKLYQETAAALVKAAKITSGMTVIDLACGTGIVTEKITKSSSDTDLKIIAVDYSSEMLAYAKKRITSRNVDFYECKAEELSLIVKEKVDRVLCNAAFWHFNKKKATEEISNVLKQDGKCLLGLPVHEFTLIDPKTTYETNKLIWMILEEKMWRSCTPFTPTSTTIQEDFAKQKNDVIGHLDTNGLKLESIEKISIDMPALQHLKFLHIPIMSRNFFLFKNLSSDEIDNILEVVENQLEIVECPTAPIQWLIYTLVKY